MKSKRQTVWLVSMLSLMVVLSAYYLFTGDTPNTKQATEGQQVTSMDQGNLPDTALGDGQMNDSGVILNEVTTQDGESAVVTDGEELSGDSAVLPEQNAEESGELPGAADSEQQTANKPSENSESQQTVSDEDVLKQLEAQGTSAADNLTAYQFQRSEENSRKTDELIKKINEDPSLDQAVMAQIELNALEEKEERIFSVEEQLQQKYANAAVTEIEEGYKVVVVSEKLEAKEAVSIMDLVIKELGVSQDKVQVQYVTQ